MKLCDENKSVGFLTSDITRLLRNVFDQKVKNLGLTRAQWLVITQLCRRDGIPQNELADLLEIKQPSLVKLLDKLEKSGLVERRQEEGNRRANRVFLLPKSASILEPMQAIAQGIREKMLANIPEKEQEMLMASLAKIKLNLLDMIG